MSKGNYGEIVGLLEYMDKVRNEKPKKGFFGKKKEKPLDLVDLLDKKQREADLIKKFIDDQHKLHKKDDDKKEKKGWDAMSPLQQAAYLTFGMQIMSLFYFSFLIKLLK